jgi:hypothetical protein
MHKKQRPGLVSDAVARLRVGAPPFRSDAASMTIVVWSVPHHYHVHTERPVYAHHQRHLDIRGA